MLQRSAGWLAGRRSLPMSARAVFGYYAHSGVFDAESLQLKRRVDAYVEGLTSDAFADIEEAIAEEFGYGYCTFEYETKLLLPAKLTLGYLYRHADPRKHRAAEEMTGLVVDALLDGDMRDALNDQEYGDFEVDFETDEHDRRVVAETAQEVMEARVNEQFTSYPANVREIYDWAVEVSERHQKQDPAFRELMERARAGSEEALETIQAEYKHAEFAEPPSLLTDEERSLPYLKTQYDRVGVIYDAMLGMYRSQDFPVADEFHRSIVLAIIGAQVWLDDVDDYDVDMADGQLTPVTAEYLLQESAAEGQAAVVDISHEYLGRAKRQATAAESALTGIATEYIERQGDPSVLPGHSDGFEGTSL